MTALTTRQFHRRVSDAQSHIAAMLFFALPGKRPRGPTPKQLRYQYAQLIRGLVQLAEGLADGFDPDMSCEACGRPIGPGQHYVDGGDCFLHARCAGVPDRKACRTETARERRLDRRERLEQARDFLRRRGVHV
jgi:hypothetical protein